MQLKDLYNEEHKSCNKDNSIKVIRIFKTSDMKKYILYLIDDEKFVDDIEQSHIFPHFKNLSVEERIEYMDCNIGNEARTYIIATIVAKHIYKKFLNEKDYWLDQFWLPRLNEVIKND